MACLFLSGPAFFHAQEPPLVGQPPNFNGAVGTFKVEMRARPTKVKVEDPLTLTIRVTALGPWQQPPQRPKLEESRGFSERFHIEKSVSAKADRVLPREKAWEFDYKLRPKNAEVSEIPPLLFVYYKPGVLPPSKGYQTVRAEPVSLEVLSLPPPPPRPIQGPDFVFQLAQGPAVLTPSDEWQPGPWRLALLLLIPPVGCGLWYAAWCARYPDAARLARQRRSKAAQMALAALERLKKTEPAERARQTAAIVAEYLRYRFDLPIAEPTPLEVADHLADGGCPAKLAEQATVFFQACDAARFALSGAVPSGDAAQHAVRLIVALENEAWPGQS